MMSLDEGEGCSDSRIPEEHSRPTPLKHLPIKHAHPAATPACDRMKVIGQWNTAWDPFYALDPVWTDAFMATVIGVYASGVMPPKEVELLSIAFDASYTHM